MEVNVKEEGKAIIVSLEGSLDTTTASMVQEKTLPLVKEGKALLLEMSRCDYVSSAGLRTLLIIAKRIKAVGGRGAMSGLSDEIRDVMEMTGFEGMFEDYKTEADALKALK